MLSGTAVSGRHCAAKGGRGCEAGRTGAICRASYAICRASYAICHALHAISRASFATCRASYAICRASHAMYLARRSICPSNNWAQDDLSDRQITHEMRRQHDKIHWQFVKRAHVLRPSRSRPRGSKLNVVSFS
eukprot:4027078-Pleurochrysis_carterae.AAC.1